MLFNCFRFQHTHLITGLLNVFSSEGGGYMRVSVGRTCTSIQRTVNEVWGYCLRVA